jgi:geranylgeranyl diphosphate synthase, type I
VKDRRLRGERSPFPDEVVAQMTGPGGLHSLRDRFEEELERFLKDQSDLVIGLHADIQPLIQEVVELTLVGGKRLRPTFCYWGFRAGGGTDGPEIVRASLAFELLHTFALIHDDIMDGSRMRRGRPTAWVTFRDLHARSAWRDSGRRDFGVSAAVLAGDLALMWADGLLASAGFSAGRVLTAFDLFTLMRVEVMAGQFLDLLEGHRGHTDEATARRICTLKAGRYTVERPLQVGLALVGGDAVLHDTFGAYGNPLGQAFQMRDDVLGVFGDPDATGKPADDDLREGKETVLVAKAREHASPGDREALDELLGSPDLDDAGVEELRRILVDSGALAETLALIDSLAAQATTALQGAPLDGEVSQALTELAGYVATRDR